MILTISLGSFKFEFGEAHDLLGMSEVIIMDVYKSNMVQPGDCVLDLGAGIGEYAVLSSKKVGDNGCVIALEPNPSDFSYLVENIQLNGCKNVIAINRFLSGSSEMRKFRFKENDFAASPISIGDIFQLLKSRYNYSHFNTLKIDIEGAETEVIDLLLPYLESIRSIPIELHGTKEICDHKLTRYGFTFHRLKRTDYALSTLSFLINHPFSFFRFFQLLRKTNKYPGLVKILGGLEITNGNQLMVGVYTRKKNS